MSLCFSHVTADRLLEALAQTGVELEPVAAANVQALAAQADDIQEVLGGYSADELPVHVLVGARNNRRSSESVVAHHTSWELPDGAIKRFDEGLYVVSPELCLLQQARELHVVNLCQMLGRYLATKAPSVEKSSELVDRSPLVSVQGLELFLGGIRKVRGAGNLREAMRWTAPAAASPQETNLQLVLTLSPAYGGFGLPMPVMNARVPYRGEALKLGGGKKAFHPDLSWPSCKIGCEYQGKEHEKQLEADCSRALAAEAMGYKLWYLTVEQLYSVDHMNYVAREIAKRLCKDADERKWPSADHVQWLLQVLKGSRYPRVGEHFAVRAPRRRG